MASSSGAALAVDGYGPYSESLHYKHLITIVTVGSLKPLRK